MSLSQLVLQSNPVTIVMNDIILLECYDLWGFDDFFLLQMLIKKAIELFNCRVHILFSIIHVDVRCTFLLKPSSANSDAEPVAYGSNQSLL
jgi:hypothetical protein